MPKGSIVPNWAATPKPKWQVEKGRIPCKIGPNIWTVDFDRSPLPLPDFGTRRGRKHFAAKVKAYQNAIAAGDTSKLGAIVELRRDYNLGLYVAKQLIEGTIQYPNNGGW